MTLLLQGNGINRKEAFKLPCIKVFKTNLILLGQYPYQPELTHKINVAVIIFSTTSILIPSVLKFVSSIRENDLDSAMDSLPLTVTLLVTLIKILNHNTNRQKFLNIFNRMAELWEISRSNGEVHILNEVVEEGSKMGNLYRKSLWGFGVTFMIIPLFSPALDYIAPLNETRPKQPLFKLNYIVDMEDHFYIEYLHTAWCGCIAVLVITTVDSLYMVIIHYSCGLFAVCGYQVKGAAEMAEANATGMVDTKQDYFNRCVITHYEAIRFYEYMDESTRTSYLFQVGLNMIGITVTAVQAVMNIDRPEETFRILMFLLGQQFHLYTMSLPGQALIDRSLGLANDIYISKWYETSVKLERILHTMQIRCSRACKLTAGGLYEMNMENFGSIFNTCVSYFTILLSVRG